MFCPLLTTLNHSSLLSTPFSIVFFLCFVQCHHGATTLCHPGDPPKPHPVRAPGWNGLRPPRCRSGAVGVPRRWPTAGSVRAAPVKPCIYMHVFKYMYMIYKDINIWYVYMYICKYIYIYIIMYTYIYIYVHTYVTPELDHQPIGS